MDKDPSEPVKDFHHPYTPYPIQNEFMHAVYDAIEGRKIGIFESPTGTGKSLSLICGALTWLREHKAKRFTEGFPEGGEGEDDEDDKEKDDDEPEWVVEQVRERRKQMALRARQKLEDRLEKIREKERKEKERYMQGPERGNKRRRVGGGDEASTKETDDDDFLLPDYDSDVEARTTTAQSNTTGFSSATLSLMTKLGMSTADALPDDDPLPSEVKIFYCSRTHSQLSQFVSELRRVSMPSALDPTTAPSEPFKHLSLGARKNLCINPRVQALLQPTTINERCLELQQPSTAQARRCAFLPSKATEPLVAEFRDHALAAVRDIEELATLGRRIGICPYYAARAAIGPAEIVTLPYQLLLQQSAREALGIELEGNVVVVDEAHNLMDTVSGLHSAGINLAALHLCTTQLMLYAHKFAKRLKGKNRVYLMQLLSLIQSLIGWMGKKAEDALREEGGVLEDGIVTSAELLSGKGVDQIDLFKLMTYLQESKLARKVDGYVCQVSAETQAATAAAAASKGSKPEEAPKSKKEPPPTSMPVLLHLQSFLQILTNPSAEGQFFYSNTPIDTPGSSVPTPDITLRYLLLDPSHYLLPLLTSSRSLILAGGTLAPIPSLATHLFPSLPPSRLSMLSCGHVIPRSNLLALALRTGASSQALDFTFRARELPATMDELGRTLLRVCDVVPDGVVLFAPSYDYLGRLVLRWTATGIYAQLAGKKRIFTETRETPSVETLLDAYRDAITSPTRTSTPTTGAKTTRSMTSVTGALLLSVVNGKMSEGINFSDSLGRAVLMVGLPFPNAHTAEWRARLQYVERKQLLAAQRDDEAQDRRDAEAAAAAAAELDDLEAFAGIEAGDAGADADADAGGVECRLVLGQQRQKQKRRDERNRAAAKQASQDFYENACMRAVNQSIGRAIRHKEDYAVIILLDRRYETARIRRKLPQWIQNGMVEVDDNGKGTGFKDAEGRISRFFAEKKGRNAG